MYLDLFDWLLGNLLRQGCFRGVAYNLRSYLLRVTQLHQLTLILVPTLP